MGCPRISVGDGDGVRLGFGVGDRGLGMSHAGLSLAILVNPH